MSIYYSKTKIYISCLAQFNKAKKHSWTCTLYISSIFKYSKKSNKPFSQTKRKDICSTGIKISPNFSFRQSSTILIINQLSSIKLYKNTLTTKCNLSSLKRRKEEIALLQGYRQKAWFLINQKTQKSKAQWWRMILLKNKLLQKLKNH